MSRTLVKPLSRIISFIVAALLSTLVHAAAAPAAPSASARATIVQAILAEDDGAKRELIATLAGNGDAAIAPLPDYAALALRPLRGTE